MPALTFFGGFSRSIVGISGGWDSCYIIYVGSGLEGGWNLPMSPDGACFAFVIFGEEPYWESLATIRSMEIHCHLDGDFCTEKNIHVTAHKSWCVLYFWRYMCVNMRLTWIVGVLLVGRNVGNWFRFFEVPIPADSWYPGGTPNGRDPRKVHSMETSWSPLKLYRCFQK